MADNAGGVTPVQSATAAPFGIDLTAEVERLRLLLERQPTCLMRVGIGGTLLAANDAAQSLLGATTLADVLGTSFVERLQGDAAAIWSEFIGRVANAGSASLECDMTDLAGTQRAVVLQGVTLPAHPDGDDSLLITVRDVSNSRRLEASLRDHQEEMRRQLTAALAQLKGALNAAIQATLLAQQVIEKGEPK
jgi:PAS domain-containing protein